MVAQARGTDGRNTYHEARVPGWHNPTQGDIPRNTVAGARSTLLVEQLCVRIDIYMCWGMCPKRPRKWRHEGGAGSAGAVMGLCRRLSRRRPEQPASVRTVGWWPFWAKGPNVKESTSCPRAGSVERSRPLGAFDNARGNSRRPSSRLSLCARVDSRRRSGKNGEIRPSASR
jgi:hypothetical protein